MSKQLQLKESGVIQELNQPKVNPKSTTKLKPFSRKYLIVYLLTVVLVPLIYCAVINITSIPILFNFLIFQKYPKFETKFDTYTVSLPVSLDATVSDAIKNQLEDIKFEGKSRYKVVAKEADIKLSLKMQLDIKDNESLTPVIELVPVGHFYWVKDGTAKADLLASGVYIDADENSLLSEALKASGINATAEEDLLAALQSDESVVGLIPYSKLDFNYKLLTYEGKYRLDESTALLGTTLDATLSKETEFLKESLNLNLKEAMSEYKVSATDPYTINMTGVTAITRGLIPKINSANDGAYPARKIGEFLASADLTHISNEISFASGCSYAAGVSFCAPESSIEALKLSGVDIVELTGNHNNDYGASNNATTIATYDTLGWDHFGGGKNSEDAQKPLIKEIDGAKVAFLGYNYYNSVYNYVGALASSNAAGANSYTPEKVIADINAVKSQVDFIIVDFQFQECYSYPDGYVIYPVCYRSDTVANQETVFRAAIDAGADMVVGTQAHQPQTYEIYKGKPIFYGLGNLYFDQINWPGTQHGLVLTHYFVAGKYVQTKITTTNYKNDMQTYVSSGEERALLLELLKNARS